MNAQARGERPCPMCGAALEISEREGIKVSQCPEAHGIWLERDEVDKLVARGGDQGTYSGAINGMMEQAVSTGFANGDMRPDGNRRTPEATGSGEPPASASGRGWLGEVFRLGS